MPIPNVLFFYDIHSSIMWYNSRIFKHGHTDPLYSRETLKYFSIIFIFDKYVAFMRHP